MHKMLTIPVLNCSRYFCELRNWVRVGQKCFLHANATEWNHKPFLKHFPLSSPCGLLVSDVVTLIPKVPWAFSPQECVKETQAPADPLLQAVRLRLVQLSFDNLQGKISNILFVPKREHFWEVIFLYVKLEFPL